MNSQIINALENLGVPVTFQKYSGSETTYITYFNYSQNEENFEDDEATTDRYYIQVDIWTFGDYATLVKNTLEALKIAGFKRKYITESYEKDTKIYHKVIRVTKREEII
jgi:hypothetical protein